MAIKEHCKEIVASSGDLHPCDRPAKSLASYDGEHRWVCGVHARSLQSEGWRLLPPERYQAEGRGVSGWVMLPVHVVVDTSGPGRIVEATPYWESLRLAQDDFGQPLDFEVCEPISDSPFWQGVDELDSNGHGTMRMQHPTPVERERWESILYEDMQEWMEEWATPTGSGAWVPE